MSQSEEQRWGWKVWKRLQWNLTVSMAVDLFVFEIHQNWFYTILHFLKFGELLL